MRRLGTAITLVIVLTAAAAPLVAPHSGSEQFRDHLYAPPMLPRIIDDAGEWHAPFVYPLRLADRLERRYEEDRNVRMPLVWFSGEKIVSAARGAPGPWLLLGADALGRDVFSRLVHGSRLTLGVAAVAVLGALLIGTIVGGLAGYAGGATDEILMRLTEFVLVLPAVYVVLALRAALPLVLPGPLIFLLIAGILALVGWPFVARGVRAIVMAERRREYFLAARSLGAGHGRLIVRHLVPATFGFLAVQATLLLPAFVLAEATLSFVGLGFPEPTASWGSMLKDAADVRAVADFPWVLSPAGAIFAVVLGLNLVVQAAGRASTWHFIVEPAGASLDRAR